MLNKNWLLLVSISCVAAGCSRTQPAPAARINLAPMVTVATPQVRTIHTTVSQPGVIAPYEQTAMFSKVAGYVQRWNVDIGARVKKGDLMAEILVPELNEELAQKEAFVQQDQAMTVQAERQVNVIESNLQAARDDVVLVQANLKRYQADVDRWRGELTRLTGMVKSQVVNPEILEETRNQFKASEAAQEAAEAQIKNKESEVAAAEAQVDKAKADLQAAEAKVKVSQADARRVAALVAYTKITAPYDGIITVRNVNTGDFVRPASGDSSGSNQSGEQSPGRAAPLFVIARTDPLMFVIGVPEIDAPYVAAGSKAAVRIQALAGREFDALVTRTSMALNSQSRTLQAEVDLANTKAELLPGMYAYGSIAIDRPNVLAIPTSAIVGIGNLTCCYMVIDGHAARTPIETGISDGSWTEVVRKNSKPAGDGQWVELTSTDQVIVGDLSEVSNGKQVAVDDRGATTPQPMRK